MPSVKGNVWNPKNVFWEKTKADFDSPIQPQCRPRRFALHYNQHPVRVGYILIPVRVSSVGTDKGNRLGLKYDGELCEREKQLLQRSLNTKMNVFKRNNTFM